MHGPLGVRKVWKIALHEFGAACEAARGQHDSCRTVRVTFRVLGADDATVLHDQG